MNSEGWNSETARSYAEFCSRHNLYTETTTDLLSLAGISGDDRVLDLACGTGASTKAVLAALGPRGTVIGVDASYAMLTEAKKALRDARLAWETCSAESVDSLGVVFDACICNAAIWQTDFARAIAAIAKCLRPGGRLAFNIGESFLTGEARIVGPPRPQFAPSSVPTMVVAAAITDHKHVPPAAAAGSQRLTYHFVEQALTDAGFIAEVPRRLVYESTADQDVDWLSIPIFGQSIFPDLPPEALKAVLHKAERLADGKGRSTSWIAFAATRASDEFAHNPETIADAVGSGATRVAGDSAQA